jgi:hypothetical protein
MLARWGFYEAHFSRSTLDSASVDHQGVALVQPRATTLRRAAGGASPVCFPIRWDCGWVRQNALVPDQMLSLGFALPRRRFAVTAGQQSQPQLFNWRRLGRHNRMGFPLRAMTRR